MSGFRWKQRAKGAAVPGEQALQCVWDRLKGRVNTSSVTEGGQPATRRHAGRRVLRSPQLSLLEAKLTCTKS